MKIENHLKITCCQLVSFRLAWRWIKELRPLSLTSATTPTLLLMWVLHQRRRLPSVIVLLDTYRDLFFSSSPSIWSHPPLHTKVLTVSRSGLPSPSSCAGEGWERRETDGFGQQERGGQRCYWDQDGAQVGKPRLQLTHLPSSAGKKQLYMLWEIYILLFSFSFFNAYSDYIYIELWVQNYTINKNKEGGNRERYMHTTEFIWLICQ